MVVCGSRGAGLTIFMMLPSHLFSLDIAACSGNYPVDTVQCSYVSLNKRLPSFLSFQKFISPDQHGRGKETCRVWNDGLVTEHKQMKLTWCFSSKQQSNWKKKNKSKSKPKPSTQNFIKAPMDLRSIQKFRADFLANLYMQASVNCPVTTESHKQNSSGAAFCQITWGFHSAPSPTSTHWLRLLDTKQLPLVSVCQQARERGLGMLCNFGPTVLGQRPISEMP